MFTGLYQKVINDTFIQLLFGMHMKRSSYYLLSLFFPIIMSAQADHFPLNVGNSWNYRYGVYDWDQLPDEIRIDTGTIRYTVMTKEVANDSTIWYLLQYRSVNRRHIHVWDVPPRETTYTVIDTVLYPLIEYHSSQHRILPVIWDWKSVYYLGNKYPDSIKFNRFKVGVPDTVRTSYQVTQYGIYIWPKIIVTSVGSIGIIRVDYSEPERQTYVRRVTAVLTESKITGVGQKRSGANVPIALYVENYPNPFNPSTTITVSVPHMGRMGIRVYDAIGREVSELFDGTINAGEYSTEWNSEGFPSGMYICRVTLDGLSQSRKMFLLR